MRTPTMPPADRLFARIDRFECECPSCGRIISPYRGKITGAVLDPLDPPQEKPSRLRDKSRYTRNSPDAPPKRIGDLMIKSLVYNPVTQRVCCPWCKAVYVAGVVLYPVPSGSQASLYAPPDVEPNARQRQQLRSYARGWYANKLHAVRDEVNIYVENSCTCPANQWRPSCPLHGANRPATDPNRPGASESRIDPDNPYDLDEVD